MRIVTIRTTHLAFQDRMMVWQLKLRAQRGVTLETGLRRLARVDDRASATAGGHVFAAGTMTTFAAHILCVLAFRLQTRVGRGAKIAHDVAVARVAGFSSDKFCAGNAGRSEDRAIRFKRAAGKKN